MTMQNGRPAGELRFRAATQLGVNFPKRQIELLVMPYETEALVEIGGRMVRERARRGSFDGIERRANRIRCNREHDVRMTVGRAIALHPSREEGLVGEFRIAQTELGEETLALADEGCLDASAGFLPMAGGEHWLSRSRIEYSKLWLGHVALVAEPAYETARVLSVRNQPDGSDEPVATPNLDLVRGWRLADDFAKLGEPLNYQPL